MKFETLLADRKDAIVERWVDLVIRTYPAKRSQAFFRNEKDPFNNPVGHTTRTALPAVFEALISGADDAVLTEALDPVIRVRAVQEFTAKEAVTFIFYLKDLLREACGSLLSGHGDAVYRFDKRVDDLSLVAFEIYTACREQVWNFKASHVKDRTMRLLQKADILAEVEEDGLDIIPHTVYRRMMEDADQKKKNDVPTN